MNGETTISVRTVIAAMRKNHSLAIALKPVLFGCVPSLCSIVIGSTTEKRSAANTFCPCARRVLTSDCSAAQKIGMFVPYVEYGGEPIVARVMLVGLPTII